MIITQGQEENRTIIRETIDGVTTEIDLTSVQEVTSTLEKLIGNSKDISDRKHISYSVEIREKMQDMDNEQLKYLVTNIVGLLCRYADLYQHTLDNPEEHLKRIEEYREFKKILGKST